MVWTDDGTYAVPSQAGASAMKSEGELKWCRTLSDWRSERAMIKTIKPNLAFKLCCINKHGPRSFDYPGPKTRCETGLFLTAFVLKILSFSKLKKKKKKEIEKKAVGVMI